MFQGYGGILLSTQNASKCLRKKCNHMCCEQSSFLQDYGHHPIFSCFRLRNLVINHNDSYHGGQKQLLYLQSTWISLVARVGRYLFKTRIFFTQFQRAIEELGHENAWTGSDGEISEVGDHLELFSGAEKLGALKPGSESFPFGNVHHLLEE